VPWNSKPVGSRPVLARLINQCLANVENNRFDHPCILGHAESAPRIQHVLSILATTRRLCRMREIFLGDRVQYLARLRRRLPFHLS
jgi:hypothetical protein